MVRAALIPTQTWPRSGPAGCASVSRNREGKGASAAQACYWSRRRPGAHRRGSV